MPKGDRLSEATIGNGWGANKVGNKKEGRFDPLVSIFWPRTR